ncbi:MAG TPA: NAD(P)H-hydrate dehydratase, partial [Planctomycetota bacterium]
MNRAAAPHTGPPAELPALAARPRDAHKGSMGRVLLVAGARGMAGAAALAANAALRAGAGHAVAAVPGGVAGEITVLAPCAVLCLLGPPGRDRVQATDLDAVLTAAAGARALAVGPGLGRDAGTVELVRGLLRSADLRVAAIPRVVDADALHALDLAELAAAGLLAGAVLT